MTGQVDSSLGMRAALVALLAMQAATAQGAGGERRVQPVASETIKISVSVAPRYQLLEIGGAKNGIGANSAPWRYCVSSNAAAGSLPTRLRRVRGTSSELAETFDAPSGTAAIVSIPTCELESMNVEISASPPNRIRGGQIMLVQPE